MAGIGLVEHVAVFLRVKHQGILVALSEGVEHALQDFLVALFHHFRRFLVVIVCVCEFLPEDAECLFQILLFQHGMGWDECHEHGYN